MTGARAEEVDELRDEDAPEADAAEAPASGAENERPRRMLDRYEIVAEIARGGMGTVLLARLEGAGGFERLMAIKLMHEHLAADQQFVTMLLDEARTAAHIHHPNAVGIVDVCESDVGYYLVMSYVEGFNLAELLAHPDLDPKERIRLGLRLFIDACHGLHAAHTAKNAQGEALGIVHRDVSPQNVMVGLDGVGRIVDFGIALAASRIASSRPGMLKGKPSYMAPEQAKGQPCDPRADVFALGIVLWEVLTGKRLFQAEMDVATLLQVMDAEIRPPSEHEPLVSEGIDEVVMKALDRDLDNRYQSARRLGVALERAARDADLLATTPEVADRLAELFSDEIARKSEAIRHHLKHSVGEARPLQPGQLGLIPRLYDRTIPPRSTEMARRGSGVTSGVRSVTGDGRTAVLEQEETKAAPFSSETGPVEAETSPAALVATGAEPRSRTPLVALLALVLLVGAGVAAFMMGRGEEPIAPASPPAVEPPALLAPAGAPEAPDDPAPVADPAPEPVVEAASENIDEMEVEADPTAEPAPEAPRVAPEVRDRPSARRVRPSSSRAREPEAPVRPRGPAIEDNPYMTR